ncbi:uncharacterized protein BYT42DRAFT_574704 [Radiomyces spectabilis]|uniref:uncharacterized protein n=1 Tax=Radiomyces spectabilis TaxID=64574 RepID=UPI00221F4BB0|nr:uncharacterized protein BYT42DRAFT_574700 [Radiomyces spectabilis]XP_051422588.1 uncharacterized protein BYT42DRAFT_574704 [Radiomyces spectabilis]KAI8376462.1 hypothetical protein BYT42DRAFT_574700 [Radiomyces spectabilis]KAI8376463.1 hypothetical protein BYT42DRAFT_574704 [Radiomyces spectabilis]
MKVPALKESSVRKRRLRYLKPYYSRQLKRHGTLPNDTNDDALICGSSTLEDGLELTCSTHVLSDTELSHKDDTEASNTNQRDANLTPLPVEACSTICETDLAMGTLKVAFSTAEEDGQMVAPEDAPSGQNDPPSHSSSDAEGDSSEDNDEESGSSDEQENLNEDDEEDNCSSSDYYEPDSSSADEADEAPLISFLVHSGQNKRPWAEEKIVENEETGADVGPSHVEEEEKKPKPPKRRRLRKHIDTLRNISANELDNLSEISQRCTYELLSPSSKVSPVVVGHTTGVRQRHLNRAKASPSRLDQLAQREVTDLDLSKHFFIPEQWVTKDSGEQAAACKSDGEDDSGNSGTDDVMEACSERPVVGTSSVPDNASTTEVNPYGELPTSNFPEATIAPTYSNLFTKFLHRMSRIFLPDGI